MKPATKPAGPTGELLGGRAEAGEEGCQDIFYYIVPQAVMRLCYDWRTLLPEWLAEKRNVWHPPWCCLAYWPLVPWHVQGLMCLFCVTLRKVRTRCPVLKVPFESQHFRVKVTHPHMDIDTNTCMCVCLCNKLPVTENTKTLKCQLAWMMIDFHYRLFFSLVCLCLSASLFYIW